MKTYTIEDLKEIFAKHIKWLRDEKGGKRADLRDANLQGADLQDAYLKGADLRGAYLRDANLQGADLQGAYLRDANLQGADLQRDYLRDADLRGAYLQGANLRDADLQDANLRDADLQDAYLRDANLQGANLQGAYLQGANLRDANLQGAYLKGAYLQGAYLKGADLRDADLQGAKNSKLVQALTVIVPQGDVIGWKKARSPEGAPCIVKLRIPADAKRSNATGRKCRAERAEVLEVFGSEYAYTACLPGPRIEYRVGQIVTPDSWDDNRWEECSHGIHFFITREEDENYDAN